MSGPELAGWVREGTEAAIPIAQALAVLQDRQHGVDAAQVVARADHPRTQGPAQGGP